MPLGSLRDQLLFPSGLPAQACSQSRGLMHHNMCPQSCSRHHNDQMTRFCLPVHQCHLISLPATGQNRGGWSAVGCVCLTHCHTVALVYKGVDQAGCSAECHNCVQGTGLGPRAAGKVSWWPTASCWSSWRLCDCQASRLALASLQPAYGHACTFRMLELRQDATAASAGREETRLVLIPSPWHDFSGDCQLHPAALFWFDKAPSKQAPPYRVQDWRSGWGAWMPTSNSRMY